MRVPYPCRVLQGSTPRIAHLVHAVDSVAQTSQNMRGVHHPELALALVVIASVLVITTRANGKGEDPKYAEGISIVGPEGGDPVTRVAGGRASSLSQYRGQILGRHSRAQLHLC